MATPRSSSCPRILTPAALIATLWACNPPPAPPPEGPGPEDLSAPPGDMLAPVDAADGGLRPVEGIDFETVRVYRSTSGHASGTFAIGDLDGDRLPDAVMPLQSWDAVAVFRADGKGGLLATGELMLDKATGAALGDLNGDGKLDVLATRLGPLDRKPFGVLLGRGDGSFAAPVYSGPNLFMRDPLLADLTGDGKLDALGGAETVYLVPGRGDGAFGTEFTSIATGIGEGRLVLADVNGDGKRDLLKTNDWALDRVRVAVLLGQGGGAFAPFKIYDTAPVGSLFDAYDLAAGDCNGDGRDDVFASDEGGTTILTGSESGVLSQKVRLPTGGGLALSDWNQDGKLDLVVFGGVALFWVYTGQGGCAFAEPRTYSSGHGGGLAYPADLDGDGHQDLVFSTGDLAVALGRGDGTFRAAPAAAIGPAPQDVTVADFNRDGKLDAALVTGRTGEVALLLGRGDGTFGAPARVAVGSEPDRLAAGDLNGDGKPDLAVGRVRGRQVVLLAGDLNGDGRPDVLVSVDAIEKGHLVMLRNRSGER